MNALATALVLAEDSDDWAGHAWWPLWPLLWAAVIGLVVWLAVRRRERRGDPLDRARGVLAERYARGEISGEEYRERLDGLARPA